MARLKNTKIILLVLRMPGLFQLILSQVCYRSIAHAIGLATKSVKIGVDNIDFRKCNTTFRHIGKP